MKECVFCNIINGDIPVPPVFRGDGLFVIKDKDPKAPIHLLIMPERHIANLDEMTEDESKILSKILMKAKDLAKEFGITSRYKVVTNVGEMAGQTVMHMHFHMLGGWNSKDEVTTQLKQKF